MGDLSHRAIELEEKMEVAARALEGFKPPAMIAPLVGDVGDSLRIIGDTLRDASALMADISSRLESLEGQ